VTERTLRYIVYAPGYNPNVGGIIFQHELVHTLNMLGQEAYLWPQAPLYGVGKRDRLKRLLNPPPFETNEHLNTPIAKKSDLKAQNTVMIYPEIVLGNPTGAQNIVRWLLYKPGDQHPYDFTEGEMFFRCYEKADLPEITGGAPDLFLWKVNRVYRNEGREGRKGVAYIVRKGHRKPRLAPTEAPGATDINGMSHEEVNDVFNRVERFYSYDEATMYSQFAVLSGCLSIVVPGEYPDRAAWNQHHDLSINGIAYGDTPEEIAHAKATSGKLLEQLEAKEKAGIDTVRDFIAKTRDRFGRA
jgi:hypothetical protein